MYCPVAILCHVPQIEHAQGAVRAHRAEDVPAASERNVVNLLVMRNQLRLRGHCLNMNEVDIKSNVHLNADYHDKH